MDARRFFVTCLALVLLCGSAVVSLAGCLSHGRGHPPARSARTLYVSLSSECRGVQPCYRSIQEAVDAADPAGDIIKVASGVYTRSAAQVVAIDKGVTLLGGYEPQDWSRPDLTARSTVLDGEQVRGRRGVSIDAPDELTVTLKGLLIRGGVARTEGGGGIHIAGGRVVFEENVVEACSASSRGGGIFISDGSVLLRSNILEGNQAEYGGALYIHSGTVILDRNTVRGSVAAPVGGAIAVDGGTLSGANNVVAQNAQAGTGLYLSGGHVTADHWTLVDNGRYAVVADLGIEIERGSVTLNQSIIASHQGGLCGAGASARRTLFFGVDYPCIAGASCVDNLFGDPKFTDPTRGDYHIGSDSAAIDQAYSSDLTRDMDGDMRPIGSAADVGADETEPNRAYLPLVVRSMRLSRP